MIWRCCTHQACLLSLCWEAQMSNGSPQPMSQVLSVPVHIIVVVVQILSTCQCRALSCPHDLESGGLRDTSMDRPCGEGGPMLQSQRTDLVLAPRRGPCPPGLTCLQETKDHTAQEAGAYARGGVGQRALWSECMRGRGALQGVLLRCHCPCQAPEPTCHSGGHVSSPRCSYQK